MIEPPMKKGILIQNKVHLLDHEWSTIKFFLENGRDIELIPPIQVEKCRTPDFVMDGQVWEMKSPTGGGKHTIKHNIQNAKEQSRNVVLDLRRCKLTDERAISEADHHFTLSKRLRKLIIITKSEEMLDRSK